MGINTFAGGTGYTYKLGINPDVMNYATKEYILVTMYHEALHAFLMEQKRVLGDAEFANQYSGYTVNGGRLMNTVDEQHWTMGYTNFVNGLRNILLAYNPNLGADRAKAMALAGITTTSPAQQAINAAERNTRNTGYVGTKCP
jgi:hypothetical protein